MKQYIQTLLQRTGFPQEAVSELMAAYDRLAANEAAYQSLFALAQQYAEPEAKIEFQQEIAAIAEPLGMNVYTANLLFLCLGARKVEQNYAAKGLPNQLFWDIMADLFYKGQACRKRYGVWGMFAFPWFRNHFCMKLFALGRFQFEVSALSIDAPLTLGPYTLQPNQRVINFHIPATGVSLTEAVRYDAYQKAMDFFCPGEDHIVLTCGSWLLYPPYEKVYPQGSHLLEFMQDFHILRSHDQEGFPDAWRVFYKDYNGSTEGFPAQTTLQRNFIQWLNDGHSAGSAYGVFVFDGQKVINR